jgi:hypothetical protein
LPIGSQYLTKGGESKIYLAFLSCCNSLIEGEQAGLDDIRELLNYNGFENTKRQDYYNNEFGLVLEEKIIVTA